MNIIHFRQLGHFLLVIFLVDSFAYFIGFFNFILTTRNAVFLTNSNGQPGGLFKNLQRRFFPSAIHVNKSLEKFHLFSNLFAFFTQFRQYFNISIGSIDGKSRM